MSVKYTERTHERQSYYLCLSLYDIYLSRRQVAGGNAHSDTIDSGSTGAFCG